MNCLACVNVTLRTGHYTMFGCAWWRLAGGWRRSWGKVVPGRPCSTEARQSRGVDVVPSTPSGDCGLPAEADAVVVGGGVVGCFTLLHLARLGCRALLLERDRLTCGTTWHTNGLLWRLRPGEVDTMLLNATRDAVLELGRDDHAGWTQNGGLFIASNKTRLEEYARLHTLGRALGVENELLTPREVGQLYPPIQLRDVTGALYSPGDGTLDPAPLCRALTAQAKLLGAKVYEKVGVTGVGTEETGLGGRRVSAVHTTAGTVTTRTLINCAGVWGPGLSAAAGGSVLPVAAMKHSMVVMGALAGVRRLPNLRDHDANMCLRVQGDALVVGGYELNAPHWQVEEDFSFGLFDFDMDGFTEILEGAIHRVPALASVGLATTICGPEAFTPDRKPLIGEDGQLRGLYHGCGFNSSGVMLSGGCAEQLAHWVVNGRPCLEMFAYDCRRFAGSVRGREGWMRERSHEAYTKNYSVVFPRDQPLAGRRALTDPLHQELTERGCFWEECEGWERPGFFSPAPTPLLDYDWRGAFSHPPHHHYPYRDLLHQGHTFTTPAYYSMVEREYRALRGAAGLVNHSSRGKVVLAGPDAEAAVRWLFLRAPGREGGSVTPSLVLGSDGTIQADVTIFTLDDKTRLREEGAGRYLVTCGSGAGPRVWRLLRDLAWHRRLRLTLTPVTHDLCVLLLLGPASGQVLERAGLEGGAGGRVRVCRHEDDAWEVHVGVDEALTVYRRLTAAGAAQGLLDVGYRALDILSLEQGVPSWPAEVRATDTPLETGLWHPDPPSSPWRDFLGRAALERQAARGVTRSRVLLTVPGCGALWGGEGVVRDGRLVGLVRRADHSFALDAPLAAACVSHPLLQPRHARRCLQDSVWEVERMGERYPANLYQPPAPAANHPPTPAHAP